MLINKLEQFNWHAQSLHVLSMAGSDSDISAYCSFIRANDFYYIAFLLQEHDRTNVSSLGRPDVFVIVFF